MDSISEALRTARYNEAVIISVADEVSRSGDTRDVILVAQLDEENGGITWKDISTYSGSTGIQEKGIVRHLRTKRWVLPMLNDKRRNEMYDAAILAACQKAASVTSSGHEKSGNDGTTTMTTAGQPIFHVLDIGSGTGLLGMMAAKHSHAVLHKQDPTGKAARFLNVTSIEMASAMAQLARFNIEANSLHPPIQVVEGHSCEQYLKHKAILCTSELLESGLLGEGLLPAFRDAWERHLHPNAVMVPQRARVYAQILEGQHAIGSFRGPNVLNGNVRLSQSGVGNDECIGGPKGVLVPVHAEALLRPNAFSTEDCDQWSVRVLSEPTMVLDFDFQKDKIPGPEGRNRTASIVPTASGIAHGVLFWWELDLWDGLTYSTEVGKEPWQDHWQQCIFAFPDSHEDCQKLVKDESVSLVSSHTDFQISFDIHQEAVNDEPSTKRPRSDSESDAKLISAERTAQLNDISRTELLQESIETALYIKGKDAPVLDLSDFSFCAIIAAVSGATQVTSLESSSGGVPLLAAKVAQIGNGLPRKDKCNKADFQILQAHPEKLIVEYIVGGSPPAIVVAEPYYEILEGWHLQEALNYYYAVKALKERRIISKTALSVPAYAAVMGCAIQFDTFANAYKACGDDLESARVRGFCHKTVNQYADRYHTFDASLPMWQYDYKPMTEPFELARISYEGSCPIENNGVASSAPFKIAGTCHGLMCWIEYGLRVGKGKIGMENYDFKVLSTNTRSYRQVVRKLKEPTIIRDNDVGNARFSCTATLGGIGGDDDHTFELQISKNNGSSTDDSK